MINGKKYVIICALFFYIFDLVGYGLPSFGLGYTNMLEGGPVRPNLVFIGNNGCNIIQQSDF